MGVGSVDHRGPEKAAWLADFRSLRRSILAVVMHAYVLDMEAVSIKQRCIRMSTSFRSCFRACLDLRAIPA